MGLYENTRDWLASDNGRIRDLCNRYRGSCPVGLLGALIVSETGKEPAGDYIVSKDRVLIESGRSQAPIYRLRDANVSPWSCEAGIWFRALDFTRDAAWLRSEYGAHMAYEPRAIWFCAVLRYSIGKGALRHVIECTESRIRYRAARGLDVQDFITEMGLWALNTDISTPAHTRYWGRQSPEKIRERVRGRKHLLRLAVAERIGPLDGMIGGAPPATAPSHLPPYPVELFQAANVAASKDASPEARERAWATVRAHGQAARAAARARQANAAVRVARAVKALFDGPHPRD
jgi:hypothetical protein